MTNINATDVLNIYLREKNLPLKSMIGATIDINKALSAVGEIIDKDPVLANTFIGRISHD